MKTPLILLLVLLTNVLYGQQSINLGTDDSTVLNKFEVDFFTSFFKDQSDPFDFKGKKIAFVTGSSGGKLLTKSEYFKICVKPWTTNNSKPQIFLCKLKIDEKIKSGGYDVIVLSWVKLFTENRKLKIINQLAQGTKE
jgi:hypothetical protein